MRAGSRYLALLVATLCGATVGGRAMAQEAIYNEAPTREDFIDALAYPAAGSDLRSKGIGRGLSLKPAEQPDAAAAGTIVEAAPASVDASAAGRVPETPDTTPSINFKVEFALNSADLSDRAQATLDELGNALEAPELAAYRFLIIGHTDASGSDAINLNLSERRALAVKDYLTSRFDVPAARLEARGVGATRLLRPDAPYDGINRRVEIGNLGPAEG